MAERRKFSRATLMKAARLINRLENAENAARIEAAIRWERFDATPRDVHSSTYREARDAVRKADDAYVELRKLADEIRKELGHD